jgi:hypothetical protein
MDPSEKIIPQRYDITCTVFEHVRLWMDYCVGSFVVTIGLRNYSLLNNSCPFAVYISLSIAANFHMLCWMDRSIDVFKFQARPRQETTRGWRDMFPSTDFGVGVQGARR